MHVQPLGQRVAPVQFRPPPGRGFVSDFNGECGVYIVNAEIGVGDHEMSLTLTVGASGALSVNGEGAERDQQQG